MDGQVGLDRHMDGWKGWMSVAASAMSFPTSVTLSSFILKTYVLPKPFL